MANDPDLEFRVNFLFQTAAEGILLTDADGNLTRLNPAAAAMLHLDPGEALQQHSAILFNSIGRCPFMIIIPQLSTHANAECLDWNAL